MPPKKGSNKPPSDGAAGGLADLQEHLGFSKEQIDEIVDSLLESEQTTERDRQLERLQEQLTEERDARREERFIFIVLLVMIFDIVIFSVMDSFGGPLALLILQLLILIPLAQRMGMQEVAAMIDRTLHRVAGNSTGEDS